MLNNPIMQHLPSLLSLRVLLLFLNVPLDALNIRRRTKDLRPPQRVAVQLLNVGPSPQFGVDEALDVVAVRMGEGQ
jgi:hypothetical protein